MPLIHTYNYGDGGIGDFLRSVFAYFVFCKKNNISYYLYIQHHPFKYCFNKQNIPKEYLINLQSLINIAGTYNNDTLEILKLLINNKDKNFIIRSNVFNFISFDELKKERLEFIKFLEISDLIKNNIKLLLKNIEDYSIIHVRCGDKHMNNINIQSDSRINLSDKIIEDIIKVKYLLKTNNVIFLTDSESLKNKIKENIENIIILNSKIYHTSLPGNDDGIIDSFTEFLIMGYSKNNIVFSNSGFSFWSSFIFDVPIYKIIINDEELEIIEFKNEDLKY